MRMKNNIYSEGTKQLNRDHIKFVTNIIFKFNKNFNFY